MYLRIHLHTANTRGRACIYVSIYIQLIPEAEYGSMYLYTANTRLCRPHFTLIFIVFMGFFSFSSFVSLIIMTYKADWVLKTKTNLTLFFCIVSSSTTLKTDIFFRACRLLWHFHNLQNFDTDYRILRLNACMRFFWHAYTHGSAWAFGLNGPTDSLTSC